MKEVEIILYVADQSRSSAFYKILLQKEPSLDVPGMTEFELSDHVKLGLMPEKGIATILSDATPHPGLGNGIPRCELYLSVENPGEFFDRGIQAGGINVSDLQNRDWGDKVAYIADPDGHVLAFACSNSAQESD